jgi:hypothetical protein
MATYQLATTTPKSIVDNQIYTKAGKTVHYKETYRNGWMSFTSDENEDFDPQEFDTRNADGFDVGTLMPDEHDYGDTVSNDIQFSDNITPKEQDKFMAIFDQGGMEALGSALYKAGWSDDYSTMFYGPLKLISDDEDITESALNRILALAKLK